MEITIEVLIHQLNGVVGLNPHVFYIPANIVKQHQLRLSGRYLVSVGHLQWHCAVIP